MTKHLARCCIIVAAALYAAAFAGTADAGVQRTFVASYGSSANAASNCSRVSPCRTFGDALSVTNAGGEVVALDSAGYGAVAITQSVSIVAAPGIYAGITISAGGGSAVTVNAGAGDTVVLQGLSIQVAPGTTALAGIHVQRAGMVVVRGCTINGSNGMGPGVFSFSDTKVRVIVRDTTVCNAGSGIWGNDGFGVRSTLEVSRSSFQNNGQGIVIHDAPYVTIADTEVTQSIGTGVEVNAGGLNSTTDSVVTIVRTVISGGRVDGKGVAAGSGSLFKAMVNISDSVIANNGLYGVEAKQNSIVRLMGTQITGNGVGVQTSGSPAGVVESLGTSLRAGNAAPGAAATPITPY